MRFSAHRHKYYCGINLHTSVMYVCITDEAWTILVHENLNTDLDESTRVIDRSAKISPSQWSASSSDTGSTTRRSLKLQRSGILPEAYAYPEAKRSTPDLLRRRMYLVLRQAELQGHIWNTRHQYNLPAFEKRIDRTVNREGITHHFDDPMVA